MLKTYLPGLMLAAVVAGAFALGAKWDPRTAAPTQSVTPAVAAPPRTLPKLEGVTDLAPIRDDQVVAAGHIASLAPRIAGAATGQGAKVGIASYTDGTHIWQGTDLNSVRSQSIFVAGASCVITLKDKPVADKIDDKPAAGVTATWDNNKAVSLTFSDTKPVTFALKFLKPGNPHFETDSITYYPNLQTNGVGFLGVSNGFHATTDDVAGNTETNVFDGFLKARFFIENSASVQFALFEHSNSKLTFKRIVDGPASAVDSSIQNARDAVFKNLGTGVSGDYRLHLFAISGESVRMSPVPLKLKGAAHTADFKVRPTLIGVKIDNGADVTPNPPKRITAPQSLTIPAVPADTQMLVHHNDRLIGIGGAGATSITLERTAMDRLEDKEHTFELRYGQGVSMGTPAPPVKFLLRRKGPTVVSVSPLNFGTAPGNKIVVRFSSRMSTAKDKDTPANAANESALNAGNYEIVNADTAAELKPDAMSLSEDGKVVTLTVASVPVGNYRLRIKSKIQDDFGNTLATGTPPEKRNEDHVFDFTKGFAIGSGDTGPTLGRGITGTTGEYVAFPEFTKFRTSPPGFNPGDHVQTRVVRLYFFRDAHRVAQIVNRDVKSFNYQAVEMRERLADTARDKADVLTDERRGNERAAVAAAEESRLMERNLADAHRQLVEARNQAAKANQELVRAETRSQNAEITPSVLPAEQAAEIVATRRKHDELVRQNVELTVNINQEEYENQKKIAENTKRTSETAAKKRENDSVIMAKEGYAKTAGDEASKKDAEATAAGNNLVKKAAAEKAADDYRAEQTKYLAEVRSLQDANRVLELQSIQHGTTKELLEAEKTRIAVDKVTVAARVAENQKTIDSLKTAIQPQNALGQQAVRFGLDNAKKDLDTANARVASIEGQVRDLQADLQAKRQKEIAANELALTTTAKEDRAREEQFRRQVAAGRTDPDTYVAGKPLSDDPVQQVSISVIGEAVIQLRGPISGMNVIRKMIHEIDAPVGQVRVAMHTVQVNGEHGDRMEKVVGKIQEHIDQSRFMTVQTSLMLRKAIVRIASQKAMQAGVNPADASQEARDYKYLYSFFGRDFVNELKTLDSEFLRTGNKLLSLHSMDTTSLAAGLFVLALAKNSTRQEILWEFKRQLECELPEAEMEFLASGGFKKHCKCTMLLSPNAKFRSFLGFFNADVSGDDTLNPAQREFIRLAQIFKSQLITEMELRQRVMERSLLEDRIGQNIDIELKAQKQREDAVRDQFAEHRQRLNDHASKVAQAMADVLAQADSALSDLCPTLRIFDEINLDKLKANANATGDISIGAIAISRKEAKLTKQGAESLRSILRHTMQHSSNAVNKFKLDVGEAISFNTAMKILKDLDDNATDDSVFGADRIRLFVEAINRIRGVGLHIERQIGLVREQAAEIVNAFQGPTPDVHALHSQWNGLHQYISSHINKGDDFGQKVNERLNEVERLFPELISSFQTAQMKRQELQNARRPLDHKKLLDMLIHEMQDKYVELLEGTRAYIANIDDYIKRVATALEDDFNTQFYQPAFREVRNASRMWDVTLGQIETTSILTNNRTFARVEPQATMEFDLPRRDILVTEAMRGAKGMVDTYGALLQDPTFLTLSKLNSGLPTSSPAAGQTAGLPVVRNVLPGLSRTPDEAMLSQGSPGTRTGGTPLDSLVPDPAIYKFETGTGYELRPVVQPDGQSVTFRLNYMYTTNVREPVRADEKHLGRIKRHFIDTDVQLGNYELREVSRYQVALKASRTAKGVPLLQDIPGLGVLFRPLPSAESALQQNIILSHAVIYPTLFDLMGLRWAQAVVDLDPLALKSADFVVRNRNKYLMNRVFDVGAAEVDNALRIPENLRRGDLYRMQDTIPYVHPNGYRGPGFGVSESSMQPGYDVHKLRPDTRFFPRNNIEGVPNPGPSSMAPAQGLPPGAIPVPLGEMGTMQTPTSSPPPIVSPSILPPGHPEGGATTLREGRAISAPAPLASGAALAPGSVSGGPSLAPPPIPPQAVPLRIPTFPPPTPIGPPSAIPASRPLPPR